MPNMTKTTKMFNRSHIIIIYFFVTLVDVINAKNIIFGKPILELNGNIKIPVFVPISWLIHDIHSAKLIGQKSDVNDMMTSDMTPDMNGNFGTQTPPKESSKKERTSAKTPNKQINNRVSDSQKVITVTEMSKQANVSRKPEYSPEIKQIKDNLIDTTKTLLNMETDRHKWIAKKGLTNEIMYEPDLWPKDAEPLFTTIEVFELPDANKYIGLESNRTAVHSAPPEPVMNSTVRLNVSAIPSPVHSIVQLSKDSRNSPYFKNYVFKNKNKFID